MPIDPRLSLMGQPVEVPNPLQAYGQVMGLRNALQQQQMGALQLQQQQQALEDDKIMRETLARANGDIDTALPSLAGKVSARTWLSLQNSWLESQKTRLGLAEQQGKVADQVRETMGKLALGVKAAGNTPEAFMGAVSTFARLNPALAPHLTPYIQRAQEDPSTIGAMMDSLIGGTEIGQKERTTRATEQSAAARGTSANAAVMNADTGQKRLAAETPLINARTNLTQQQAAGTDPVSIYRQKMIEQGAQRIAQGAKRLEFEGKRVAIEGQRAAREATKKDASEQAIEAAAQSLASGDLTRLRDIASLRGDQRLLIFNRAKELNPNFNTGEIDRKLKMEEAFTTGKDGQNLQSFGVFLEHAGAAKSAIEKFKATDAAIVNKSVNWLRSHTSSPQYRDLLAAYEPVKKEFESFLLNNRALYTEDRKNVDAILNEDLPIKDALAAINRMAHTSEARYREMNYRYKRTMGRDLKDAFSPEAISAAREFGLNLGGGPSQQQSAGWPKIGTSRNGYVYTGGDPNSESSWKKER